MNAKLGILSLSRRWNSALMWSHYCGSHSGFCIGFDRNHPFFPRPTHPADPDFIFEPVVYSTERHTIPARTFKAQDAFQILLTKSVDWEYEEEERLIDQLSSASKTIAARPYDIALFEIPKDAV